MGKRVLNLAQYRAKKFNQPIRKILSLSPTNGTSASPLDLPLSPFLEMLELHGEENLVASLHEADLILLDAQLDWADPISLISTIQKWKDAPLVLVCPQQETFAPLIKQAYAAGISDILYAPIEHEEFTQILDVFLRLKTARTGFDRIS